MTSTLFSDNIKAGSAVWFCISVGVEVKLSVAMMSFLLSGVAEGPDQQVVAQIGVHLAQPHRLNQQENNDQRAINRMWNVGQRFDPERDAQELRQPADQTVHQAGHQQNEGGPKIAADDAAQSADDHHG